MGYVIVVFPVVGVRIDRVTCADALNDTLARNIFRYVALFLGRCIVQNLDGGLFALETHRKRKVGA